MKKPPVHTGHMFRRQATGSRESLPVTGRESQMNIVAAKRRRSRRACAVLVVLCLVFGVSAVVLMPMLARGADPFGLGLAVRVTGSTQASDVVVACADVQEAQSILDFTIQLPLSLPEDSQLTAVNVVNGKTFEAVYLINGAAYSYRMAKGTDDPSGDGAQYAYTTTEELEDVMCRFSGATADKLQLAVWIRGDYIYSVMAPGGVTAASLYPFVFADAAQPLENAVSEPDPQQDVSEVGEADQPPA